MKTDRWDSGSRVVRGFAIVWAIALASTMAAAYFTRSGALAATSEEAAAACGCAARAWVNVAAGETVTVLLASEHYAVATSSSARETFLLPFKPSGGQDLLIHGVGTSNAGGVNLVLPRFTRLEDPGSPGNLLGGGELPISVTVVRTGFVLHYAFDGATGSWLLEAQP